MKAFKIIKYLGIYLSITIFIGAVLYWYFSPSAVEMFTNILIFWYLPFLIFHQMSPIIIYIIYKKNKNFVFPIDLHDFYKKLLYTLIASVIFYITYLLLRTYFEPSLLIVFFFVIFLIGNVLLYFYDDRKSKFDFIELGDDSLFICDYGCSFIYELKLPNDREDISIEDNNLNLIVYYVGYFRVKFISDSSTKKQFEIPFNTLKENDVLSIKTFLKQLV